MSCGILSNWAPTHSPRHDCHLLGSMHMCSFPQARDGMCSVHAAAQAGRLECLKYLVQQAGPQCVAIITFSTFCLHSNAELQR